MKSRIAFLLFEVSMWLYELAERLLPEAELSPEAEERIRQAIKREIAEW